MDYSVTKKKGYFYFAAICIFLTGLILQSINGIAAAHMQDVGLSAAFVASVLSIHSLALAGFKFLTGIIYDRFGLRITMNMCDIAALIAILLLASLTNSSYGMTFSMIYAVLAALAFPLETIILPIFSSDLFGDKSFNKVLGIFGS